MIPRDGDWTSRSRADHPRLIETPGGFEYTGADFQGWMRDAGLRQTRIKHLVGPDSMVIGIKQEESVTFSAPFN
jgi:hypothetical protein